MKYYIDDATGQVYAYEDDGSQDGIIPNNLRKMAPEEVEAHLEAGRYDALINREAVWVISEMVVIADQLLMLEDSDPNALPGTERQWRDYRITLRAWKDGAEHYPDMQYRPQRPA
ncbi:hypothetical protein IRZ59_04970 [Pseudomonas guariconensis]|uniref:hypothetical protein n=1 Tax=Pseudomonas guariconensis TaxID=1288410 RepID=UPI0018A8C7D8|nr:hypothetical protein [Pseudomonas guariconensis]MBF8729789.1 hypothetical protein [Pseudomonas guariconensis]